jgi:hypothetical protein
MWKHDYEGKSYRHVYDKRDTQGIKNGINKHGVVVVGDFLSEDEANTAIKEMYKSVIFNQPLKHEHKAYVLGKDGRRLQPDVTADEKEFLEIVKNMLSKEQLKIFKDGKPLHSGFGASCDNTNFHMKWQYEVRQDPYLYAIFREILEEDEVWVTFERGIWKLCTEGVFEFLHMDCCIAQVVDDIHKGIFSKDVSGKINLGKTMKFACVPGTHTQAFMCLFYEYYLKFYPKFANKNTAKTGLEKNKPDPLGLVDQLVIIDIPPRAGVFWCNMVHGVKKNKGETQHGMYIGAKKAGSRPRYKQICGIDEREDRVNAWKTGHVPKCWPSLDKIHLYPNLWNCFQRWMDEYIEKMPVGHPMIVDDVTQNGKHVKRLKRLDPVGHVPYPLTQLGRLVIGVDDWSEFLARGGKVTDLLPVVAAAGAACGAAAVAPVPTVHINAGPAPAPMSRREGKQKAESDDDCVFVKEERAPAPVEAKRQKIVVLD